MIEAVVFDLDGTITRFNIDVHRLKADLGMGTAIVTRNNRETLDRILKTHSLAVDATFPGTRRGPSPTHSSWRGPWKPWMWEGLAV